jgi:mannose/cellobiose epimerase-like protein (N-acyl-D-glucosamine 2-epimerase family)
MHLLEALLAAHDAFGDVIFFARAEELVLIFLSRFFQAREGALPEYFDAALAPRREAGRFLVGPGHHYEWVWFLDWYAHSAAAMGRPVRPELRHVSDALFEFADRFAVDPIAGLVATVRSGMAAFGCGLKPSGSRRKPGAGSRRRTIWRGRSSPSANTSKVSARGFGSSG